MNQFEEDQFYDEYGNPLFNGQPNGEYYEEKFIPSQEDIIDPVNATLVLGEPVYTPQQELALNVLGGAVDGSGNYTIQSFVNSNIQQTLFTAVPIAFRPEQLDASEIYFPFQEPAPIFNPWDGNHEGFLHLHMSNKNQMVALLENEQGKILLADEDTELTAFMLAVLQGEEMMQAAFEHGQTPWMIAEHRIDRERSAIESMAQLLSNGLAQDKEVLALIEKGKIKQTLQAGLEFHLPFGIKFEGDFWKGLLNSVSIQSGLTVGGTLHKSNGLFNKEISSEMKIAGEEWKDKGDFILPMDQGTRVKQTRNKHGWSARSSGGPAMHVSYDRSYSVGPTQISVKVSSKQ